MLVPGFVPELRQITAPSISALPNRRVVHRTSALMGGYGRDFHYTEGLAVRGPIAALFVTFGMLIITMALALPFLHPLIRLLRNRPRQGTSSFPRIKTRSHLILNIFSR